MRKRKRTSIIWTLPKNKFEAVVSNSNSIAEIIRHFGFSEVSTYYKMIKKRCEEDSINISHISLGLDSNKGRRFPDKAAPLEEVMVKNSSYSRSCLKKRLLKEEILKNECSVCFQKSEHNGKKLVMVLDHINGVNNDNRLENLRLLCPNCNSQQNTFAGRNYKRIKKKYYCKDCGKKITRESRGCCVNCARKNGRKVKNRPSREQLIKEIEKTNYCAVGREYGVSDNCIK